MRRKPSSPGWSLTSARMASTSGRGEAGMRRGSLFGHPDYTRPAAPGRRGTHHRGSPTRKRGIGKKPAAQTKWTADLACASGFPAVTLWFVPFFSLRLPRDRQREVLELQRLLRPHVAEQLLEQRADELRVQ